jgi:hypothetical protein
MHFLLLAAVPVSIIASSCTGVSNKLPDAECTAWQDFVRAQPELQKDPTFDGYCAKDLLTNPCNPKSNGCVTCNLLQTHVKMITMYTTPLKRNYTALTGTLPDSIGQLSELTYLELFGNRLYGSVPASIREMSNLVSLDLKNNKLDGVLPKLDYLSYSKSDCDLSGQTFDCPLPPAAQLVCHATCSGGTSSKKKCPVGCTGIAPNCECPVTGNASTPSGTEISAGIGGEILVTTFFGTAHNTSLDGSKPDCSHVAGCNKTDCTACIKQYW